MAPNLRRARSDEFCVKLPRLTEAKPIRKSYGLKTRKYACARCPSAFGSKMELEEHENSHTGVKPFACDICQTRFNRRSTLWNHKRIHVEHKPFQCPICKMEFKWKNSLKCHRDTHLKRRDAGADKFDEDAIRKMSFTGGVRRRYSLRRYQKQEFQKMPNLAENKPPSDENRLIYLTTEPVNEIEINADADDQEIKGLIALTENSSDYSQSSFLTRFMIPSDRPSACLSLPTICFPDDMEIYEKYYDECEIINEDEADMFVVDKDADIADYPDGAYFLNLSYISECDAYVPSGSGSCRVVVDHESYAKVLPVEEW